MLTQEDMDLLIDAMRANGVTRLEYAHHKRRLYLNLSLPAAQAAAVAPKVLQGTSRAILSMAVKSPGIGRLVARGAHDGLPALLPGSAVSEGEPLGYIAQGPVLQLLVAPQDGTLSGAFPAEGQTFGFGDTVFEMEQRQ